MSNTSATGGYLLPQPIFPELPGTLTFNQFLQTVFVGVSGLPAELVRPKWQVNPPKQPDIYTDWMAIALVGDQPDANAFVGASLGQFATGSISFKNGFCLQNPRAGDTITVNGVLITFVTSTPVGSQVLIGTTPSATAFNLQVFLASSSNILLTVASYAFFSSSIIITYNVVGSAGNAFTLATVSGAICLSAPTLLFGSDYNNTMQRHADLEIQCAFLGPHALEYADIVRDGFQMQQNLENLRLANMGFVSVGKAMHVPDLINERWVDRFEMTVAMRREIIRTYPVLSFASARGTITADLDQGLKTVAWNSNA